MPKDRNDPLSKQNTKDRFYGSSDPVANKILGRQREREEQAKKVDGQGYDNARATLYLRFQGDAPYPKLTELDIRDQFYSFGEIISVRVQAEKGQAFVEYTEPDATELAIASMNRRLFSNRQIQVRWARAPRRGDSNVQKHGEDNTRVSHPSVAVKPMAPPGGISKSFVAPKGLTLMKPPDNIAAIAAARRNKSSGDGGGPIRRMGANVTKSYTKKPYYPSADPGRLGSETPNA